jgi:hypothetical protein
MPYAAMTMWTCDHCKDTAATQNNMAAGNEPVIPDEWLIAHWSIPYEGAWGKEHPEARMEVVRVYCSIGCLMDGRYPSA